MQPCCGVRCTPLIDNAAVRFCWSILQIALWHSEGRVGGDVQTQAAFPKYCGICKFYRLSQDSEEMLREPVDPLDIIVFGHEWLRCTDQRDNCSMASPV